jgi:hypothetical protein
VDAYRTSCRAMLERFGKTGDPITANNVLLTCVVKPDSIPDAAKLIPLLDIGRSVWHWGSWIRCGTLYRAGKYEESLRAFEEATRINRPRAWDWCFAAMAHHRLGHVDESRRCLTAAARWIDEANAQTEHELSDTEPNWSDWPEREATSQQIINNARFNSVINRRAKWLE